MSSKFWFWLSLILATVILGSGAYVYFEMPELLGAEFDAESLENTIMTIISSFGGVSGLYLIISTQLKQQTQLALTNGKISQETYDRINGKLDSFISNLTAAQETTNSQLIETNESLIRMEKRLDESESVQRVLLQKIEERDAKITAILGSDSNESEV